MVISTARTRTKQHTTFFGGLLQPNNTTEHFLFSRVGENTY